MEIARFQLIYHKKYRLI